jgi:hypothetical protein
MSGLEYTTEAVQWEVQHRGPVMSHYITNVHWYTICTATMMHSCIFLALVMSQTVEAIQGHMATGTGEPSTLIQQLPQVLRRLNVCACVCVYDLPTQLQGWGVHEDTHRGGTPVLPVVFCPMFQGAWYSTHTLTVPM